MAAFIIEELIVWIGLLSICLTWDLTGPQHFIAVVFVVLSFGFCMLTHKKHMRFKVEAAEKYLMIMTILAFFISTIVSISIYGVVGRVGRNFVLSKTMIFYMLLLESTFFLPLRYLYK
jgi:hypothetical protein